MGRPDLSQRALPFLLVDVVFVGRAVRDPLLALVLGPLRRLRPQMDRPRLVRVGLLEP
jgi:hypothetical protein